jgi:flotillin
MHPVRRHYNDYQPLYDHLPTILTLGTTGSLVGYGAYFMLNRYMIASPNQYIVKTGMGLDKMYIGKKTFVFPFQKAAFINMAPSSHRMTIDKAMSKENIAFKMPIAFTVGIIKVDKTEKSTNTPQSVFTDRILTPPTDDPLNQTNHRALNNYASTLIDMSHGEFEQLINVVVAGACRRQAGELELREIFNDRVKFREAVIEIINYELEQFGVEIKTMSVEELEDMDGNEYFVFLRKRALEGAVNRARIDVAEKQKEGEIGQKKHEGEARMEKSEIEMKAKLYENVRNGNVCESDAKLNVAKVEYQRTIRIATLEADANAKKKELELQKEIEELRKEQETHKLRASKMSDANVRAEVLAMDTDASARAMIEAAKGDAETKIQVARAQAETMRLIAEARLLEKQNEALGIRAIKEAEAKGLEALKFAEARGTEAMRLAEANGLRELIVSAGGSSDLVKYMIVQNEIPVKVADANARAMQNLKPEIKYNFWGQNNEGDKNDFDHMFKNIIKATVPSLEYIKQQTGVDLAEYFKKTTTDSDTCANANVVSTDQSDDLCDQNITDTEIEDQRIRG